MSKKRLLNKKMPRKKLRSNSKNIIKNRSTSFHPLFWLNLFLTTVMFFAFYRFGIIGHAINAAGLTFFLPLFSWAFKKVIPPAVISNSLIKKFYLPQFK